MGNKKLDYLYGSIDDDIIKAGKWQIPVYTNFFNLAEQAAVERVLMKADDVKYIKLGGYKSAERCIFCIYSVFIDYDAFNYIPIKVLVINWNGEYYQIKHRDVLGAILGLGIKREVIGDIIIEDDTAYVFVLENIAPFIIQHLIKVGPASTRVECRDIDEVEVKGPNVKSINAVVPSIRLDCIAGAGFGMSRTKSVSMIRAGRVMLNWETCTKAAQEIEPGDIITIRGKGRIRYRDMISTTRRGRFSVEIERFI